MKKNKGFTLIELVITISIISITLPALLTVLMTLNKAYAKTLHALRLETEAQYVEWSIRDKIKKPNHTLKLGTTTAKKNLLLIHKTRNISVNDKLILSDFEIKLTNRLSTITYIADNKPVTLNISRNYAQ